MAKQLSTADILAAARKAGAAERPEPPPPELCRYCKRAISRDNRIVYRDLCLHCYRTSTIGCDRCGTAMLPETHRINDGLCFECFLPAMLTTDSADRTASITAFLAQLPFDLPDSYVQFLRTYDGRQRYSHRSLPGKFWRMASVASTRGLGLADDINIDGQTAKFWQSTSLHAASLRTVYNNAHSRVGHSIVAFGFDRMAAGFAIGEENSDVLFLDTTDNYSMWCFHHDGELKRVAPSFAEWFKKTSRFYEPPKRTAKSLQSLIPQYVGYWVPVSEPKRRLDHLPSPHYEFLADGRARCIYVSRTSEERCSESYGLWRIFGKDKLGFQNQRGLEDKFKRLEDGSIHADNNPDYDVMYSKRSNARSK